jgi:predicted GNAT superfamily acetyltransferase/N-acetylglutamate synthase-like GNAT family acetyltransferase
VTEAQVSCRWATLEDMTVLRELFRRAALSNVADRPLLLEHPEFLELSEEHVAAGRSRVAVTAQGEIVGFATTICTGEVAELEDLFVDAEHQHQSIGTLLLNDAATVARRHSAHRIELTANPSSMNFYLRKGFVSLGDMVLQYGRAVRMRLEVPELGVSRAAEQAQKAAARAGVTVVSVREIETLEEMSVLFADVWGGGGVSPMNAHILRAMTLAGNYVAAAMQVGGGLVGGSAGFAAIRGAEPEIHSHVTAVRPELRRSGIGLAMKLHQRAWALDRSIRVITWTFDPLVRRNAVFNISRLGGRPTAYLQNVYGNMGDEINRDGLSDRFWLRWELETPAVEAAVEGLRIGHPEAGESGDGAPGEGGHGAGEGGAAGGDGGGGVEASQVRLLLSASPTGAPELERVLEIEPGVRYLVSVPQDIETMRRESPAMAAAWRQETRGIFTEILASGGRVSISRSGDYIVERGTEGAA